MPSLQTTSLMALRIGDNNLSIFPCNLELSGRSLNGVIVSGGLNIFKSYGGRLEEGGRGQIFCIIFDSRDRRESRATLHI